MTTTITRYRITASFERDGQIVRCDQAEVLGEAHGATYETEQEAQDVADELQGSIEDVGLDSSTRYKVESVEVAIMEYDLNMVDRETPSAWMGAQHVVKVEPYNQDSGRCRFRIWTTDPAALEAALDADDDVLEYEAAQ